MKKKEKGFSLIELIIAIAILIILTGLLAPQFMKYIDQARRAKMIKTLDSAYSSALVAYTETLSVGNDHAIRDNVVIKGGKAISNNQWEKEFASQLTSLIPEEDLEHITIFLGFKEEYSGDKSMDTTYIEGAFVYYYPDMEDFGNFYYLMDGINYTNESGKYGEYVNGKYIKWR